MSATLFATATTGLRPYPARPTISVFTKAVPSSPSMLDSLRNDITSHPADYVTCETEIAAQRFLAKSLDARRETDRTMIGRGVVGYWRNKTIVVVPSLSSLSHLATGR